MAIVGALPIQLANGTLADATQVMSDFNYVVSQVNANAAGLAGGNAFTGAQTIAGNAIVTATASQTLSNKTFATTTFTGNIVGTNYIVGGDLSTGSGRVGFTLANMNGPSVVLAGISYVGAQTAGAISFVTVGDILQAKVLPNASAVNYLTFIGAGTGTTPFIAAAGTDTNVTLGFNTQGTGGHAFFTGSAGQFQVLNTTGSTRTVNVTGSVAGNPTISTSAGNLAITPLTVFAAGVTISSAGLTVTGGTTTDTLAITAGAIITGSGANAPVGVTNIQGVAAGNQQWMRVGNVVTVSGGLQIDPTSGSASTVVALPFPVASTITAFDQVGGTASGVGNTVDMSARVIGDTANHRAIITYVADAATGNANWSYQYTYIVV